MTSASADEARGASREEGAASTRLLVADDDRVMRLRLKSMFAQERAFELVGVAADAEEAIRLATEHRPDAALVDVNMPGGGGAAVVREMQRISPGTAVVILSSLDERNLVLKLLEEGAMSYVVKGAQPEEIFEAIRRSIDAHAFLDSQRPD